MGENTAALAASLTKGEYGKSVPARWIDKLLELEEGPAAPQDSRTPEEVIEDIKQKVNALSPP